jgi:rhodanese-related sulfurtransferase
MDSIKQIIIISAISIILGFISNVINPNKIEWTGEIINVVETGSKILSLKETQNYFKTKKAIFIDARPLGAFNKGHIPGAINLPIDLFEQYYPDVDNEIDENDSLIIYCTSLDCHFSASLAEILTEYGYKKIMLFEGGIVTWEEVGLPIEKGY